MGRRGAPGIGPWISLIRAIAPIAEEGVDSLDQLGFGVLNFQGCRACNLEVECRTLFLAGWKGQLLRQGAAGKLRPHDRRPVRDQGAERHAALTQRLSGDLGHDAG